MALQSWCCSQPKCQLSHPLANLANPDPGPGFLSLFDQLCATYNRLQIQVCTTHSGTLLLEWYSLMADYGERAFRVMSLSLFDAVTTVCTYGGQMWALFFENVNGRMTSSHILVNLVGHGNPEAKD